MSDEYIRKQDVLNLPQSIERNLCGEIVERSIDVKAIESLEPADVVPVRHAEWIRTESFVNGTVTRIYKCSRCDGVAGVRADNGFWYKSNFCPHCGAKMEE